ncbi:MAG: endonuclease/exonuclease/phosphatase family protein [Pseudomonadota bacterium]
MPYAGLAENLRIATFNAELQRDGPGLLVRDILRGDDPQIAAVVSVFANVSPDIVAVQGFDYDLRGNAVSGFLDLLSAAGVNYPYWYATRPNTGLQTGLDMDGNGRRAEPRDAQGYGRFSGQGGMVILSRFPILQEETQDFSTMLWRDLPDALLPEQNGAPFPSQEVQAVQRLSTTGHWIVPVDVPVIGRIDLLTFHASPPVFDGPEDRNGRRNHDEIRFWQHFLDGAFGTPPSDRFVLLGDANQDPEKGEGRKEAIRNLLADPRLQDPTPLRSDLVAAAGDQDDTVDWDDPVPGNMRVDYVLPSSDWQVSRSGVYWPAGEAGDVAATASRHRMVWVDLVPPD